VTTKCFCFSFKVDKSRSSLAFHQGLAAKRYISWTNMHQMFKIIAGCVLLLLSIVLFSSPGSNSRTEPPGLFNADRLTIVNSVLDEAIKSSLEKEKMDLRLGKSSQTNVDALEVSYSHALRCQVGKGRWRLMNKIFFSIASQECSQASDQNSRLRNVSQYISTADGISAARLCPLLQGKKILLIGPETTYQLHSMLLSSLEDSQNMTVSCPGPQSCTFHHVCRPLSSQDSTERYHKLPSDEALKETGSAILRYVHSHTIDTTPERQDEDVPHDDPLTGIRRQNGPWISRARWSDIIIVNRGPSPAPAWTYNTPAGNWTFTEEIPCRPIYPRHHGVFDCRTHQRDAIINAELHATLDSFLPSALEIFRKLRSNPATQEKLLIWHGSWYSSCVCSDPMGATYLYKAYDCEVMDDLWSLYYNAQGLRLFLRER
jgi:hypothetical protein